MIGFWDGPHWRALELPRPQDLVGIAWRDSEREKIAAYLRSGVPCAGFMGSARCRLCDEVLGSHDLTDGEWIWPERLEHYITAHDVRLPDVFIARMKARSWRVSRRAGLPRNYSYDYKDFDFWRQWAAAQQRLSE